jgi:hypothetical protein
VIRPSAVASTLVAKATSTLFRRAARSASVCHASVNQWVVNPSRENFGSSPLLRR